MFSYQPRDQCISHFSWRSTGLRIKGAFSLESGGGPAPDPPQQMSFPRGLHSQMCFPASHSPDTSSGTCLSGQQRWGGGGSAAPPACLPARGSVFPMQACIRFREVTIPTSQLCTEVTESEDTSSGVSWESGRVALPDVAAEKQVAEE